MRRVAVACLLLAAVVCVASLAGAAVVQAPVPAAAAAIPLDPDAATRAYLATMAPEARAASDAYFEGGYWLLLWGFLVSSAIGVFLLHAGVSARMRDLAGRVTRVRFVHTAAYWAMYVVVTSVLGFPLGVYADFFREHRYGLSNMTFGAWLGDQAKELVIAVVLGAIFVPILYAVVRRAPRTWWMWGAVVAILFAAFATTIEPVFLAPLFNDYTLLKDESIKRPILALARANGIDAKDVYEFDASRQSKRISANVSGFGATQRISLNDNLLRRASPQEIQAVMGHEMGHYVLNHIPKMLLQLGLVILVGFAFVHVAFERLRRRYAQRWRVEGIDDPAGLPLIALLLGAYVFVTTPVTNTIIRTQEIEADMFGLNAARQPDAMATVALKLSEYRKMEPGPLEELVFYDHPSGRSRIHAAMQWKAEHVGDTPLQPIVTP